MTKPAKKRLHDAVVACKKISEFTDGVDFRAYDESELLQSAVERQLEMIGEALGLAARIDSTLVDRIQELPRIIALRNRVIHGYDTVDNQIIWDVVTVKVPELTKRLQDVLQGNDGGFAGKNP